MSADWVVVRGKEFASIHRDEVLRPEDIPRIGEALSLCHDVYQATGRPAEALVLNPVFLPGYVTLNGLPIIRNDSAPLDRPWIVWGRP